MRWASLLQVEDKTPFAKRYTPGEAPLPSNEDAAEMYRMASRTLTGAGFEHYEISNYARPGHRRAVCPDAPFLADMPILARQSHKAQPC